MKKIAKPTKTPKTTTPAVSVDALRAIVGGTANTREECKK